MAYELVASTNDATVLFEYTPNTVRSDAYQSEEALENSFIAQLCKLGYGRLFINCEADLLNNLRSQLEKLNNYTFSDSEWKRFFEHNIANQNDGIVEKTKKIQEDYIQVLKRDDGSSQNIMLINKENIHANSLQVINQYTEKGGNHETRYDVTILVNGLPLVHIELKKRSRPIKEAFDQIERYQRESFWASCGLYEYIQIFVISNGTSTKYYSNTTRISAIKQRSNGMRKVQKTSHSFEFTSYWADSKNNTIFDLVDFTNTFFVKHTLLNVLTKYCVLTSENLLLVMRPYQIFATEQIINRIHIASNNPKLLGTSAAGGYIWHTTGSGKTLTSFKAAQLASKRTDVDKVLFVVDRKDLDYQTMKEYDRFEKGAADGNKNTATLKRQLENKDANGNYKQYKIIVTTIQKLSTFVKSNPKHEIFDKRVVLIFDECHRSQFGSMNTDILRAFKKYSLFGFTGTPIFADNAKTSTNNQFNHTTAQVFGDQLHTYTIVDAIRDGNVLPFKVDYVNTMKKNEDMEDGDVEAIDVNSALLAPARISAITSYILSQFNIKTMRGSFYGYNRLTNVGDVVKGAAQEHTKTQLSGFNSIFAVSSIEAAMLYYSEFKKQMAASPKNKLKIATIFSYAANDAEPDGFIDDENSDDTTGLDMTAREFLEGAITDYNNMFNTSYDAGSKFSNYYKDLSLRMKNREIDLLIVVNMFLTGFDATTLNTLWVDKNLEYHGLIQAFSRTNRILNSVKRFGNIICFRDLQGATEDAISLFGNNQATGLILLKTFDDYYNGYDDENKHHAGYREVVERIQDEFPISRIHQVLISEKAQKEFVTLFGKLLRLRNILGTFDEFYGKEILPAIDFQDYVGIYTDIKEATIHNPQAASIMEDVIFEMELVKHVQINIDYILEMVEKYRATNCQDVVIRGDITRAIRGSYDLRSKKELVDLFVDLVNVNGDVRSDWKAFVEQEKEKAIQGLIAKHALKDKEAREFIANAFKMGEIKTVGTAVANLSAKPAPLFGKKNSIDTYQAKKQLLIDDLQKLFDTFYGAY